jgi:hypothetical protein
VDKLKENFSLEMTATEIDSDRVRIDGKFRATGTGQDVHVVRSMRIGESVRVPVEFVDSRGKRRTLEFRFQVQVEKRRRKPKTQDDDFERFLSDILKK